MHHIKFILQCSLFTDEISMSPPERVEMIESPVLGKLAKVSFSDINVTRLSDIQQFNPRVTNGLSHPYHLDQSISF